MSGHDTIPDDGSFDEIERLLGEMTESDLDVHPPPDDLWASIEREAFGEAVDAPVAPVTHLSSRRRATTVIMSAAAALVLVVAAATVVLVSRGDGDEVVATADLAHDATFDPLGTDAVATASLRNAELSVDAIRLPNVDAVDADLELWLIRPDATGQPADLISLGLVRDGETYTIPDGIDTTLFSVVDISIEPRDGDDAHSGRSILRGALIEA